MLRHHAVGRAAPSPGLCVGETDCVAGMKGPVCALLEGPLELV